MLARMSSKVSEAAAAASAPAGCGSGPPASVPLQVAITAWPEKPANAIQVYGPVIVAVIAALIAGTIAYRQWKTAADKLRLDLFEKRWKVFKGVQQLLGKAALRADVTSEDLREFLVATEGARWLFDPALAEFLEDSVYKKALRLQELATDLKTVYPAEADSKRAEKTAIVQWFGDELKALDARMDKRMKIIR
jgi:hypothetical protein